MSKNDVSDDRRANADERREERIALVSHLRRCGIGNERVLGAIAQVPRERFVPSADASYAYRDVPVPIGLGQTVSQPRIVAQMTEALELGGEETVLEIGTGSGYQTAVLACLCAKVISIERHEVLSREAAARLEVLGVRNAFLHVADGTLGWPAEAPYDAILATGSLPEVPETLLSQLASDGGIFVGPVGSRGLQQLVVVRRSGIGYTRRMLGGCRFVPLIGNAGWSDGKAVKRSGGK